MESARPPTSNSKQHSTDIEEEETKQLAVVQFSANKSTLEQEPTNSIGTGTSQSTEGAPEGDNTSQVHSHELIDGLDTANMLAVEHTEAKNASIEVIDTLKMPVHAAKDRIQETSTTHLK